LALHGRRHILNRPEVDTKPLFIQIFRMVHPIWINGQGLRARYISAIA
jgi:hypothetical protein